MYELIPPEIVEFSVRDMAGNTHLHKSSTIKELRVRLAMDVGTFYPCIILLPHSNDQPLLDTDDPLKRYLGEAQPYACHLINKEECMKHEIGEWSLEQWINLLDVHAQYGDGIGATQRAKQWIWHRSRDQNHENALLELNLAQSLQEIINNSSDTFDKLDRVAGRIGIMASLGLNMDVVSEAALPSIHRGRTLLHQAAQVGHRPIAQLLLESRAQVDLRDEKEQTPLVLASHEGHTEIVRALLGENAHPGLAIGPRGRTPIHYAARKGHSAVVDLLLRAQGDVDGMDFHQWTALQYAASRGHSHVVHLLARAGASIDAPTNSGNTPLYSATMMGHCEAIRALILYGADRMRKNEHGKCACDVASEECKKALLGQ